MTGKSHRSRLSTERPKLRGMDAPQKYHNGHIVGGAR